MLTDLAKYHKTERLRPSPPEDDSENDTGGDNDGNLNNEIKKEGSGLTYRTYSVKDKEDFFDLWCEKPSFFCSFIGQAGGSETRKRPKVDERVQGSRRRGIITC